MVRKNAKTTTKKARKTNDRGAKANRPVSRKSAGAVTRPSYTEIVNAHEDALNRAGSLKSALDVARLLDDSIFAIPSQKVYGFPEQRERVFNTLCAILVRAGLQPLPLEEDLVRAFLPASPKREDQEFAKKFVDHIKRVCATRLGDAAELLPLAKALGAFNCTSPYGKLEPKNITCLINSLLLSKGLEPVLPDYAEMRIETAVERAAPTRPVRIVVVDDDICDLLKTALALVGWPQVETALYRVQRPVDSIPDTPENKSTMLRNIADQVASLQPDVVLMDQGLCQHFGGHELVPEIAKLLPQVQFVANTGGTPDQLNAVGARGNCSKGQSLRDVEAAVLSCC